MINNIKKLIAIHANLFGYKCSRNIKSRNHISENIIENEFGKIYRECKNYSMTSLERMYALHKSVEFIVNSKINGDFVECGVWRGGSAMVIAHTLIKMKETDRKIYLYDTFAGMSKPSKDDVSIRNGNSAINRWKKEQKKEHNEWTFASLSEVKKNMFSTGYPQENIIFIKGNIEDTVPEYLPSKIAVLRLDTDWYESTKHELNYLYPLLSKHGVLIIDDYGHWAGAKKAVDEYIAQNKVSILLNRIDYTGRIGVKMNESTNKIV